MTAQEIIEFLQRKRSVLNRFGVKSIALFGSYVSGQATNNSDIDLLVEFKEGEKTFDNYMDLKFYLEDNLNKDVDLVIKDALKEELKADILGSAKYAQAWNIFKWPFGVDLEIVWNVIKNKIPQLKIAIEDILSHI